MGNEITEVRTFGDVRQLILQTIMQIRDGGIEPQQGLTIAAHFKCLNDNINAEVNATKVAMLAKERGYDFGNVVKMGTKLISNNIEA